MEDPVLVPSSHVGEPVRVTSDSYNSVTTKEDRVVFIHCSRVLLGTTIHKETAERWRTTFSVRTEN